MDKEASEVRESEIVRMTDTWERENEQQYKREANKICYLSQIHANPLGCNVYRLNCTQFLF